MKSNTINGCINLLKYSGFWQPDFTSKWKVNLYRMFTAFTFVNTLVFFITIQTVDLVAVWGNIPLMTADAFLLLTNFAHAVKMFMILAKKSLLQQIIHDTEKLLDFKENSVKQAFVDRHARNTIGILRFYLLLCSFTLSLWSLGPFFSQQEGALPLNGWYPYSASDSPAYELTYIHQIIVIFISAALNIIVDTLITSLISQIGCQLQILKYNLNQMTDIHNILNDSMESLENNALQAVDIEEETSDDYLYPYEVTRQRLVSCIEHHQQILTLTNQMEECFSFTIFVQLAVSLFIICVSAFQIAEQNDGNSVQLFGMGLYLCVMLYQVFIYCWHGNEVIIQSKDISMCAYSCMWYKCSPLFKKDLRTLMTQTIRPLQFTAYGFVDLSVVTFMKIIKTSYSLFTLLQKMDDQTADS